MTKTKTLLLASHNKGKIKELTQMLSPFAIRLKTASDFNLAEPEETGTTFKENALLKAKAASKQTGLPALADDSGLCVHGLENAPGIYSARWAGEDKNFSLAMEKLLKELASHHDRSAHFNCTLALSLPTGQHYFFEGLVYGTIASSPRGGEGFGYDPIFIPEGYHQSFAELGAEIKKKISHRAIALEKFLTKLPEIL